MLSLTGPFAPLIAVLTDAGMIVSPKAAQALGEKFNTKPVCAGPFRFVERIAQDRIVVERFPQYWNKGAIHFDKVTYLPIVDSTVRLANLKSGQLDFIERMAPSDVPGLKDDKRFKVTKAVEMGYQGLTINVSGNEFSQKTALGKDARVREALELSLDREPIVQVAQDGEGIVGNQWVQPKNRGTRSRCAGETRSSAPGAAEGSRRRQSVVHADGRNRRTRSASRRSSRRWRDAGFEVKIQSTEFATALALADRGSSKAFVLAWSGGPTPTPTSTSSSSASSRNNAGYCNLRSTRCSRRRVTMTPQREALSSRSPATPPRIGRSSIFHRHWISAYTRSSRAEAHSDALVRLQDLKLN